MKLLKPQKFKSNHMKYKNIKKKWKYKIDIKPNEEFIRKNYELENKYKLMTFSNDIEDCF